jgi:hypothetical protein
MLDTIKFIRRHGRLFVTDGVHTYPAIAGADGDDDPTKGKGEEEDDETDDADDDPSDDDDEDDDELGDAGKKTLDKERKARKDAEREARRLKRQNAKLRRQSKTPDKDDVDDDRSNDRSKSRRDDDEDRKAQRLEVAREKAEARAERYALRAGVDGDRVDRFVKLIDLDPALDEDGSIDNDELKELIADELEDWPEFKKSGKDDKNDEDPGDPERGARRIRPRPINERVESNLDVIARRTGIELDDK